PAITGTGSRIRHHPHCRNATRRPALRSRPSRDFRTARESRPTYSSVASPFSLPPEARLHSAHLVASRGGWRKARGRVDEGVVLIPAGHWPTALASATPT